MRALPWILGGGAAALVGYYWRRGQDAPSDRDASSLRSPEQPGPAQASGGRPSSGASGAKPAPLPGRWVWPVGVWRERKPEISSGFATPRTLSDGHVVTHGGVDIMYRRQPGDPWPAGTPNGTPGWVMPGHRAALAASDGVVWSATNTPRGWTIVIDHSPRKLATYYTHLSSLLVQAKQPVSAGTPLGIIGADPLDGQHVLHLHFEVWRGGSADRFDPQPLMEATWEHLPDPGDRPPMLAARNASPRRLSRAGFPVFV
ncbi:MAG TPA: M23 family metallopeptidase, partial [Kofleriaceae bacterium]|nr:M23 family metallopeptidase [Kofleriaceae bacterium]